MLGSPDSVASVSVLFVGTGRAEGEILHQMERITSSREWKSSSGEGKYGADR